MISRKRPFNSIYPALLPVFLVFLALQAIAQTGYQKAPKAIADILNAPPTPSVSLSPARDRMLLLESSGYPSISELAEPMLRLGGLRINPNTNGPHRGARLVGLRIKTLADGKEIKVQLPAGAAINFPSWSPDGKQFAFSNTLENGIELWIGNSLTGAVRRIPGIRLNATFGDEIQWLPDSRTLLVQTIPAGRGAAPVPAKAPIGPTVQENYGKATPAATFQDLLRNRHDEDLFDYYVTSQLQMLDTASGKATPVSKPAIFLNADPSPDGKHILVVRVHRPYSYLHTAGAFPKDVEIWDHTGKVEHTIAKLPLQDQIPIEGVPTGPRSYQWRPTTAATVVWVEALDGGDTRKKAPLRDRVLMLKAPFQGAPEELAKTEHRFAGVSWGEKDGLAILRDADRSRRWGRAFVLNADNPSAPSKKILGSVDAGPI